MLFKPHHIRTLEEKGIVLLRNIQINKGSLVNIMKSVASPISYLNQPMVMDIMPKIGYDRESSGGVGALYPHTDLAWHPAPIMPIFCILSMINQLFIIKTNIISSGFKL